MGLKDLIRPELEGIAPYVPVQGDFAVRLDANEAPDLLSEAASRRLGEAAAETEWRRYPDATLGELRQSIAKYCDVSPDEITVGAGSDELISLLLTVFSQSRKPGVGGSVVTSTPSFVMYKMSSKVRGFRVIEVPMSAEWRHEVEKLVIACEMSDSHLLFLASPNNPTGTMLSRDEITRLASALPDTLVVLDEAYVDYADVHHLDVFRKHPNVVVLRTLSKMGFAALRIGWLIGNREVVAELEKVRQPYNIGTVSQRLASIVLDELGPEVARTIAHVRSERARVTNALDAMAGITPTPSQANFVWVRTEAAAETVFTALADRGVLVRSFHKAGGRLANQLRITLGTRDQNDLLLKHLSEVL